MTYVTVDNLDNFDDVDAGNADDFDDAYADNADDVIDDGVNDDDDDDVDGDAALETQFWPDLDLEKAGGRAAIIFKRSGQLQHLLS